MYNSAIDDEEYKIKTGMDHDLLITNVPPENVYIYDKAVTMFDEIEMLDKAYNIYGDSLKEGNKAIVFKEKINFDMLQKFWSECDKVERKH